MWTHAVLLAALPITAAALLGAWAMGERRFRAPAGNPGEGPGLGAPVRKQRVLGVVLGPLFMAALLLSVSLAALFFPGPLIIEDFRVNTGLILFVAYASSLFPSYAVVSVLRLLQIDARREPKRDI